MRSVVLGEHEKLHSEKGRILPLDPPTLLRDRTKVTVLLLSTVLETLPQPQSRIDPFRKTQFVVDAKGVIPVLTVMDLESSVSTAKEKGIKLQSAQKERTTKER